MFGENLQTFAAANPCNLYWIIDLQYRLQDLQHYKFVSFNQLQATCKFVRICTSPNTTLAVIQVEMQK